ncbi:hypothetical protein [Pseudoduganella armeniaca]|uniref:Uncharacterized protein n=1 Tax=Pseudoduganella armeniaca TaxID=2072590 RepID=A0A2R4CD81_9BURK|nr:hypothetical protein [Pseudoduganella armeniaca]AVR97430.1 hypothetical protein C9I28_18620 [Pseudoduganella armeniaca]
MPSRALGVNSDGHAALAPCQHGGPALIVDIIVRPFSDEAVDASGLVLPLSRAGGLRFMAH